MAAQKVDSVKILKIRVLSPCQKGGYSIGVCLAEVIRSVVLGSEGRATICNNKEVGYVGPLQQGRRGCAPGLRFLESKTYLSLYQQPKGLRFLSLCEPVTLREDVWCRCRWQRTAPPGESFAAEFPHRSGRSM